MADSKEHYEKLLAERYSWMFGGFEKGVALNEAFFKAQGVTPRGEGFAVDLGAGCGFQSIPLAKAGFSVMAVDLDHSLLSELEANKGDLPVKAVQDDILNVEKLLAGLPAPELAVCMTDTVLHLASKNDVEKLFRSVFGILTGGGRFIISFREQGDGLKELDRFIPVRSDADAIMTCFLEYEPEFVKVHDLVHVREGASWTLRKSFYRKLRLSGDALTEALLAAGFAKVDKLVERGMSFLFAEKPLKAR